MAAVGTWLGMRCLVLAVVVYQAQSSAVTTLAGQSSSGFADGAGANAKLSSPFGVSISLDGENFERVQDWTIHSARGSILKEHHPMRRWRSIEADLSRYGGRRVTLRLEAASRSPGRPDMPAMGWFGSPRIIDSQKVDFAP